MRTVNAKTSSAAEVSRRAFVFSALATTVAGCVTRPGQSDPAIIDTHTHFYDPTRPEGVPWPPREDALLYRAVLPGELKRMAQPLGVRGTVVVEASPRIEDNRWVLEMAAHEPFILGLVGHLKPGTPSFAADLRRFASNRLFRGIRAGGWEIALAPQKSDYVRDLGLLAQRGLSLDVLGGPDQLEKMAQLAELQPDLTIVINHCAGVRVDGRAPDPAWTAGIRKVAIHPKVYMKVSGLVEGSGREFLAPKDPEFYRPTLDVLWKNFGEDRLIFGSNWPVSARFADYETVLSIPEAYFRTKGVVASRKYFQTNAMQVYGVRV